MKTSILLVAIFILSFSSGFAQISGLKLEASIVSVSPDPKKHPDENYNLKIKIVNKTRDSLVKGDTIIINSINWSTRGEISKLILSKPLYIDSICHVSIDGFYLNGVIEESRPGIESSGRCGGVGNRKLISIDTGKHRSFIAVVDFQPFFPVYESSVFNKGLEIDFWQSMSQLSVKFYSSKPGQTPWKLTDNLGRTIGRGYLDAKSGSHTYTIYAENIPAGRYTLSIGNGSDELDGTFTVIGR